MSIPSFLVNRLAQAGITEAAIIDDVFDGPASLDIETRLNEFREYVEDDPQALKELTETYNVNNAASVNIEVARTIWRNFDKLKALKKHASILFSDFNVRFQIVETIAQHLKALGIEPRRYPDAEEDLNRLPPDSIKLVFLDYSLSPDAAIPSASSEWCATKLCERGICRPFLVLISDHADAEQQRDSFRRKTNQLGGTFAFIRKQDAQDTDYLYLQLATWGLGHPAHSLLQTFFESVNSSVDETVNQFKETIRELDIQDYSFLQRICLQEDGQPLGEYMLDFLTGLLSHKFRASRQVQESRKALDNLIFENHIPSVTQPSTGLAKTYRLALTDPVYSDIGPHPHDFALPLQIGNDGTKSFTNADMIAQRAYLIWESAGKPIGKDQEHWLQAEEELSYLPLLNLGDIFTKDSESNLWMVVNAACDLLFSPRSTNRQANPEQPIYLIPGILIDIHTTSSTDGKEVTELFEYNGKAYRILWDYRFVRSIALKYFEREMTAKGYCRSARLTLPYALRVQSIWTAHLGRVGLPSPPPMFQEAQVSILAKGPEKKWEVIVGPVPGGAVIVRKRTTDHYEDLFVLTTQGDAAISSSFGKIVKQSEERIEALEAQAAQPTDNKKNFFPEQIRKSKKILEDFNNLRHNLDWRLGLLEVPRAVNLTSVCWIIENKIAVYFRNGVKREYANQAELVIEVENPTAH